MTDKSIKILNDAAKCLDLARYHGEFTDTEINALYKMRDTLNDKAAALRKAGVPDYEGELLVPVNQSPAEYIREVLNRAIHKMKQELK